MYKKYLKLKFVDNLLISPLYNGVDSYGLSPGCTGDLRGHDQGGEYPGSGNKQGELKSLQAWQDNGRLQVYQEEQGEPGRLRVHRSAPSHREGPGACRCTG